MYAIRSYYAEDVAGHSPRLISGLAEEPEAMEADPLTKRVITSYSIHYTKLYETRKKTILPRTPMQAEYLRAMQRHDLVFGLGPAGTGKTYLAVAMAVSKYLKGRNNFV